MLPEWTLDHLLLNSAERRPDHAALVDGGRECVLADLSDRAGRVAAWLKEHGINRGERVGIHMEKTIESVVALLGISRAGAIFVNINPLLRAAQVRHIVRDCGIRCLFVDSRRLEGLDLSDVDLVVRHGGPADSGGHGHFMLAELMAHPAGIPSTAAGESDLATIIYTSGSTGQPKGIMLSHHNLVAGAQIVSTYLENDCSDRVLSVLPFSFDYGLNQLTTMLRVGGTLVLQRSLMPGDILSSLRNCQITGLAGVPPVWTLLLQNRRSLEFEPLAHLRYLTNSGGMIPGAHFHELRRLLPRTRLFLMYGLTEAFRSTFLSPDQVERGPGCIGKAIPNTDVWVVGPDGRECAPGAVGQLVHRGPTVAMGYWGDPDKTAATFKPNPFAPREALGRDTVVYSGDLVSRDGEGYLHFHGRSDEQVKIDGFRVSPLEVEEVLYGLDLVHEAAALGVKDGQSSDRIVAFVSIRENRDATAAELRTLCRRVAPHYLVPAEIRVVRELPKTSTGKIDRSELKRGLTVTQG